jgi:hypothetical protein
MGLAYCDQYNTNQSTSSMKRILTVLLFTTPCSLGDKPNHLLADISIASTEGDGLKVVTRKELMEE